MIRYVQIDMHDGVGIEGDSSAESGLALRLRAGGQSITFFFESSTACAVLGRMAAECTALAIGIEARREKVAKGI